MLITQTSLLSSHKTNLGCMDNGSAWIIRGPDKGVPLYRNILLAKCKFSSMKTVQGDVCGRYVKCYVTIQRLSATMLHMYMHKEQPMAFGQ